MLFPGRQVANEVELNSDAEPVENQVVRFGDHQLAGDQAFLLPSSGVRRPLTRYRPERAQSGSQSSIGLPSGSWMRANRPTPGASHSGLVVTSIPLPSRAAFSSSSLSTRKLSVHCLSI